MRASHSRAWGLTSCKQTMVSKSSHVSRVLLLTHLVTRCGEGRSGEADVAATTNTRHARLTCTTFFLHHFIHFTLLLVPAGIAMRHFILGFGPQLVDSNIPSNALDCVLRLEPPAPRSFGTSKRLRNHPLKRAVALSTLMGVFAVLPGRDEAPWNEIVAFPRKLLYILARANPNSSERWG